MSIKSAIHDTAERIGERTEEAKSLGMNKAEQNARERRSRLDMGDRAIMAEVRMIGAALVTILIIALVLNEVYAAVDIGEGPFSDVVDDLETTGVAALSLLIVGLIIVAASAIMRVFGGGGFGAR